MNVPRGTFRFRHCEERSNLKMKDQYRDILKSIKKFKRICSKKYRFLPVTKEADLISFENKFNVKSTNKTLQKVFNNNRGLSSIVYMINKNIDG